MSRLLEKLNGKRIPLASADLQRRDLWREVVRSLNVPGEPHAWEPHNARENPAAVTCTRGSFPASSMWIRAQTETQAAFGVTHPSASDMPYSLQRRKGADRIFYEGRCACIPWVWELESLYRRQCPSIPLPECRFAISRLTGPPLSTLTTGFVPEFSFMYPNLASRCHSFGDLGAYFS